MTHAALTVPLREAFDGEPVISFRLEASAQRLRLARRCVREAALACGCSEESARDIVIAVDEACQNIIRHAYGADPGGDILVDIRRDADSIIFNLLDFASPVDPQRIRPRDLDDLRPGGLGTHFMRACMDEVEFRPAPEGAGNWLWMRKKIHKSEDEQQA